MSETELHQKNLRMLRRLVLLVIGLFVMSSAYIWYYATYIKQDPLKAKEAPDERGNTLAKWGKLPEFMFTDSQRRPFGLDQMLGRVWVCDFVFTRCQGPCPEMTRSMKGLSDRFANEPRVGFLTITADPDYDTPERLNEFAMKFGADFRRWFWVGGDKESTFQVCRTGFLQAIDDPPENSDQFIHSTRLSVVDANGEVRSFVDALASEYNKDPLGAVEHDVKLLLKQMEAPERRPSPQPNRK